MQTCRTKSPLRLYPSSSQCLPIKYLILLVIRNHHADRIHSHVEIYRQAFWIDGRVERMNVIQIEHREIERQHVKNGELPLIPTLQTHIQIHSATMCGCLGNRRRASHDTGLHNALIIVQILPLRVSDRQKTIGGSRLNSPIQNAVRGTRHTEETVFANSLRRKRRDVRRVLLFRRD